MTLVSLPCESRARRTAPNPGLDRFGEFLERRGVGKTGIRSYVSAIRTILTAAAISNPLELTAEQLRGHLESAVPRYSGAWIKTMQAAVQHLNAFRGSMPSLHIPREADGSYYHPQDRRLDAARVQEETFLARIKEISSSVRDYVVRRQQLARELETSPAFRRRACQWARSQNEDCPWPDVAAADMILALDVRLSS